MTFDSAWLEVVSQDSAEVLLDATRGFHDSIATKACWEGAEFVNDAGELEFHGYGVLCLEISSQFEDVTPVELRFEGVASFGYTYDLELDPVIQVRSKNVLARLGAWEIRAEKLEYKMRPRPQEP